MGSEREVAAAVCFLLDAEKSSYVNGANLMVDGGFMRGDEKNFVIFELASRVSLLPMSC